MPTYFFDQVAPVQTIISAEGKFGPDLRFQTTALYEVINVFGGTEWALFMTGTPAQTLKAIENNPFVVESGLVWSVGSSADVVEVGSVARMVISRQIACTILKSKFGDNEQTAEYINTTEHQEGLAGWDRLFANDEGFNRLALIDDYETYVAVQQGG